MISAALLREFSNSVGLSLVSTLSVCDISNALLDEKSHLAAWQSQGFAGEMHYMKREPALFVELERFLPNVKSVLSFCISYFDGEQPVEVPEAHGRIARYAWGKDYHQVIPERLNALVKLLQENVSVEFKYRIFTDAVPLLERSLARLSGQGFIGKNTLLIRPGIGSFTFLGEILLDIEVESISGETNDSGCKTCFRCKPACPTGAIVGPRSLDASKCISYLTIEKRGAFEPWEEEAIGEWLFGCDICQDVCPFNNKGVDISHSLDEFILSPRKSIALEDILSISSDQEYREIFKSSAILRAKREQLIRNACFVAANKRAMGLIGVIERLSQSDPSELVRKSARSAVLRLGDD